MGVSDIRLNPMVRVESLNSRSLRKSEQILGEHGLKQPGPSPLRAFFGLKTGKIEGKGMGTKRVRMLVYAQERNEGVCKATAIKALKRGKNITERRGR